MAKGLYLVKKQMIDPHTNRPKEVTERVRLTGREADRFYHAGVVDDKGGKRHSLDRRK